MATKSKGIVRGGSAWQRAARRKAAKRTAQKRERTRSLKKQYSDAAKRKDAAAKAKAADKAKRDAATAQRKATAEKAKAATTQRKANAAAKRKAATAQRKEKIAAAKAKAAPAQRKGKIAANEQKRLGRVKNRVMELERKAAAGVGRATTRGAKKQTKRPSVVYKRETGTGKVRAIPKDKIIRRGRGVMYGTPAAGAGIGGAAYLLSGSDKPTATSQELSFAQALKGAKDGGQKTFTWKGSKYSTTKTGRGGRGARGRQKVLPGFRPFGGVIAKALLGKDEAFGGDKGLIDFVRLGPQKKRGGGMANKKGYASGGVVRRSKPRGVGAAKRGYGKAMRAR